MSVECLNPCSTSSRSRRARLYGGSEAISFISSGEVRGPNRRFTRIDRGVFIDIPHH